MRMRAARAEALRTPSTYQERRREDEEFAKQRADFGKEKERAPTDLKHLLDEVEFIEYRRRDFEAASMVQELLRRGGVVPAAQAKEGVPPQRRETTTTMAQEPEPE